MIPERSDEPIVGWRCWFVMPHERVLRPILKRGLAWTPRQAVQAICPEKAHMPPADGCRCGIWAISSPKDLSEIEWVTDPPDGVDRLPGVLVVGQIAMWGEVVEHERGWRSSLAYPKHLYVFTDDTALATDLRDKYLVPVVWGADAEEFRAILDGRRSQSSTSMTLRASSTASTLEERYAAAFHAVPTFQALLKALNDPPLTELIEQAVRYFVSDWYPPLKEEQECRDKLERLKARIARGGTFYGRPVRDFEDDIPEARQNLTLAAAKTRACRGDATAARRILWSRLVRWHRDTAASLRWRIEHRETLIAAARNDLARGRIRGTKKPYTPRLTKRFKTRIATLKREVAQMASELRRLQHAPIPQYHGWCAMVAR